MSHSRLVAKVRLALGGLGILVVAGGGMLAFGESATIDVTVPVQTITAHLAMNLDSVQSIPTRQIDAQVTDSIQGTSSTVTVTPAYATGAERLLFRCPTSNPCSFPWTLPAGTVVTSWPRHIAFATTQAVTFGTNLQVQFAGIRALAPGSSGNQPAGSIEVLPNSLGMLVATNPNPTTGGVDGGTAQIVQQADIDTARASLMKKVDADLSSTMAAAAAGRTYALDGLPTIETATDRNVGDKAATFTVTITARETARAFSTGDAQAMLRSTMQPLVPPGYTLAGPIQATFDISQGSSPIVSVDATGRAVPRPVTAGLGDQLAGLSSVEAIARLHRLFPGSSVEITSSPVQLPWLPLLGSSIHVRLQVSSGGR